MKTTIVNGKKIAGEIKEELRSEISRLAEKSIIPVLAVIIVGNDPASEVYVRSKKKTAEELGLYSQVFKLDEETSEKELLSLIGQLNSDNKIHGILVQMPVPKHISEEKIILAIDPKKDVDCFHPENIGKIIAGGATILPCTPAGIIELLKRSNIEISGKNVVVIGRSNIVGKPAALMMLAEGATVTICHSKTKELIKFTQNADIIIAAAGRPNLVTADMIKEGVVIIDVGINRMSDGRLVGDVDYDGVSQKVSAITPVPGGVGPMTIVMLMKNSITAAKLAKKLYEN